MQTKELIIGAIVNEKTGKDAILECLEHDGNFAARIQQLYISFMDARPLPVEIVRQISNEGDLSIKELKKSRIRLAFYIDSDFSEQGAEKAIIMLLYFSKHDNKATARAIIKAQTMRDRFLMLKEQGELKREVITNV